LNGKANYYLNLISEDNYLQNVGSGVALDEVNAVWSASLNLSQTAQFKTSKSRSVYPTFCFNCWYYLTVEVSNVNRTQYRLQFNHNTDNATNLNSLRLNV
jgi:hypothetical protein